MSVNDLKQQLVNHGVDITSRQVKARLNAAKRQAYKETDDKFNVSSKEEVTKKIQHMLSLLAIFFVGGFLVAGNIATIIMFPVAEYTAVRRGIMAFEAHNFVASFNAATIVVGYVVMLFVKYALRDNLTTKNPKSITRQLYKSTSYTIYFIQISIVLFGFLGRTSQTIATGDITIVEIIGYTGTFILTIALLATTDITILFIYSVFASNVGLLNLTAGNGEKEDFLEERLEALQIEVLTDLLIMTQQSDSLTE
jgi:hypothetical protein